MDKKGESVKRGMSARKTSNTCERTNINKRDANCVSEDREELYQVIGKMRKVISGVAHLPFWLSVGPSGHRHTSETAYIYDSIAFFRSSILLLFR